MVLKMFFLSLSKAEIRFAKRELVWKTYTATKALPTTRIVEIIDKKEFAAAALNVDDETFVVHVAALAKPTTVPIYHSYKVQVIVLTSEETRILAEYSDISNVFSLDSLAELPEYMKINDHPINLLDNMQ